MNGEICLCDIDVSERAQVTALTAEGSIRRRFLDIGIVPGTRIECVGKSPCGDPSAYLIRGAVIAIRREDAANILVKKYQGGEDGTYK